MTKARCAVCRGTTARIGSIFRASRSMLAAVVAAARARLGRDALSWLSWQIVTLLAASAVLWVLFAARLLTAREPFIPVAILARPHHLDDHRRRLLRVGTIIGLSIYTPLYCQVVLGVSRAFPGCR